MPTHSTGIFTSIPSCVAIKTQLVRKATGKPRHEIDFPRKSSEPCLWFLLRSKWNTHRSHFSYSIKEAIQGTKFQCCKEKRKYDFVTLKTSPSDTYQSIKHLVTAKAKYGKIWSSHSGTYQTSIIAFAPIFRFLTCPIDIRIQVSLSYFRLLSDPPNCDKCQRKRSSVGRNLVFACFCNIATDISKFYCMFV